MATTPPLAELLKATAAGDEQAFSQLYAATSPRLFAVVLRIVVRRDWAEEFGEIPIITTRDGSVLRLRDLAEVSDAFEDVDRVRSFNGQPAMSLEVYRVGEQTPLGIAEDVRQTLDAFAADGLMTEQDASLLADAYRTYRARVHARALQEQAALAGKTEFHDVRREVTRIWRQLLQA